jgi:hypothetical protein
MVPAERFDVVIDFAGFNPGTEIILRNDDTASPTNIILPYIMKFTVQAQTGHTAPLPATLTQVVQIPVGESAGTRYFNLVAVGEDCAGKEWVIQTLSDGTYPVPEENILGEHWDDIDAYPVLGTTEIWEFINGSEMMHPMHIHLVQFQILDRCPLNGGQCEDLAPHELNTWKDTVSVPPQTRVRVIMRFENYLGKFPAHCHLLDHEDHEMMRQFQTTSGICDLDGECEFMEEGITCADCGWPANPDAPQVSGAFCGNALCEIGDGENFDNCPADCAGKTKGKNPFSCTKGDPDDQDNPGTNCGFAADGYTVEFDGCITNGKFCRVRPRVIATCGDQLCEGQEQVNNPDTYCAVDCEDQCIPTEPDRERTCEDMLDNDCDGLTDLQDPDCNGCQPTEPDEELTCDDGIDNDCDTFTDGADSDCVGGCAGFTDKRSCNDAFGCRWDRKQDPPVCVDDCTVTEDPEVSCNDGQDNDCDGLTDGDDPDCQQCVPDEAQEVSCFDGNDNDCNGSTDCADANCDGKSGGTTTCGVGECAGNTGERICQNGAEVDTCDHFAGAIPEDCDDSGMLDEDCDGSANEDDPDCPVGGCSSHPDKQSCNDDPNCKWRSQECTPR